MGKTATGRTQQLGEAQGCIFSYGRMGESLMLDPLARKPFAETTVGTTPAPRCASWGLDPSWCARGTPRCSS